MDRRQRTSSFDTTTMETVLRGWQSGIWTALPAFVVSFDPKKATVQAQPTIQMKTHQPDGSWTPITLPVIPDVPVNFPHGGGGVITIPLYEGDEGLLIFASRCIDGWWQNGGIQPQAEFRMHDLSDAIFIPGPFSQPNLPAGGISMDGMELRSMDGSVRLTMIAGGFNVTGFLHVSGEITADGEVTGNGIPLSTHTHGGGTIGDGETGEPVAP